MFSLGELLLVNTNGRLGNKLTPLYVEETVEADLGTSVRIIGRRPTRTTPGRDVDIGF